MFDRELAFAHEVSDRAAEIALGYFLGEFSVRMKPDASPVTDADLAVEAMFREEVARSFPGDVVTGEEQGRAEGEREWVLDPIDGTKNFADGVPVWATLIALHVEGRGVLAVVSSPALGERYHAVRGEGAMWNGRAIRVSERSLPDAFFVFSSVEDWIGSRRDVFEGLVHDTRRSRGFGDFWGHMLVARGAADIMAEQELAVWDWAAPKVIVEEAGGRVTTYEGDEVGHGTSVLTTNGVVHDEIVKRLSTASP
jgi:histidinol-phosphatase